MLEFDAGSFKDPEGRVFYHDGGVYRTLSSPGLASLRAVCETGFFRDLLRDGLVVESALVESRAVDLRPEQTGEWVVRQTRVPVVTYPFEWSFDMLRDAALVTLEVLERALGSGWILKDATPFNLLFHRNRPVWIDVLSLERRTEGEPWVAYAQFCRGFLFPLLLNAYRKIDFQPLLRSHMGEVPLATARHLFSSLDALRPGVLKDVFLQAKLERGFAANPQAVGRETSRFAFSTGMILANVRRLRKIVAGLSYPKGRTTWGQYAELHNYTDEDAATKRRFVAETLASRRPEACLDLGCNTGDYSDVARELSGSVTSIDADPEAINAFYLRTRDLRQNRTLVVADLSNPSPPMGWALRERKPLYERVRGDFFLALALIHHLRITAGIPLESIVDQLAGLAPAGIVEWVDRQDEMIPRMLALRKDVYEDYTWEAFQRLLRLRFRIERVKETHRGNRRLCHVTALAG